MLLIQSSQHAFHDRLAEHSRLSGNLELTAILVDGCEFLVIQINDMSVRTLQGSFLFVKEIR